MAHVRDVTGVGTASSEVRGSVLTPATTQCSQINLQHCKAATALLCHNLAVEQTDICLIQEPWIIRDSVKGFSVRNGDLFYSRSLPGPRACVLVKGCHSARGLANFCTRDLVAVVVDVWIGGRKKGVVFCSAYFPCDSEAPPPTEEFCALVSLCRDKKLHLIVGCDANSQHTIWGSNKTTERGISLVESLTTWDMEILNRGSRPTFVTTRCQEVIDLTLSDREAAAHCVGWKVEGEDSLSDHRRIVFSIQGGADVELCGEAPYRNPRATDWRAFRAHLEDWLPVTSAGLSCRAVIEKEVEFLQDTLTRAYHAACPARTKRKEKGTPWWNRELDKCRRLSRKLWNRAYCTDREDDWAQYRVVQRQYKGLIKDSKRDAWRKFCSEVEALPQVARLQRVFARGHVQGLGGISLPNGQLAMDGRDILKYLIEVHFPDSTTVSGASTELPFYRREDTPNSIDWGTAMKIVTMDRLRWAVDSFDKYKSPGPDGIYPVFLQEGGEMLIKSLLHIFRACLALGYTPKRWREVKVTFIPKPGKCSYDKAKDFRPISLSSFLLKTLERLVDRYIKEGALSERPVHSTQHAYQEGKSTETALHALVRKLEDGIHKKSATLGVFIDIEGAFDNTTFEEIGRAMQRFGIEPSVAKWVLHMLGNRTITAGFGEASASARVGRGCPQGGVISPLLWLLVVDDLLAGLEKLGVMVAGYADDVALAISNDHAGELHSRMQKALNFVQQWCLGHGLRVNPDKTEMVLFTRRRKFWVSPPSIFGKQLQFAKAVRYLGIWLDKGLRWNHHLMKQADKVTRTFWACRRLFGPTWGLRPHVVKWLYEMIMVPQFTYGAAIWWTAMDRVKHRTSADRLTRLAGLGISGCLRTTPTLALLTLLNIPPLHLVVREKALATAIRMRLIDKWREADFGHARILREGGTMLRDLNLKGDTCGKVLNTPRGFETTRPTMEEWAEGGTNHLTPKGLVWYTDGSTHKGRAGAGIWSEGPVTQVSLGLDGHINATQAEIAAIRACARLILSRGDRGKHIYICSDSLGALRSLTSIQVRSELIRSCIDLLNKIAKANWLRLVWVPGHLGIKGNVEADRLARYGRRHKAVLEADHIGTSTNLFRPLLKGLTEEGFRELWIQHKGSEHSRYFLKQPRDSTAQLVLGLPRTKIRTLVGLVTGHWPTGAYLARIGKGVSPICTRCGLEDDTPLHQLTRCSGLEDERFDVFGACYLTKEMVSGLGVSELLEFSRRVDAPRP